MEGTYTAVLVRSTYGARDVARDVTLEEARAAINSNWQHRNHPENVLAYVILNEDGFVTQTIQPNIAPPEPEPEPESYAVKPKREALSI